MARAFDCQRARRVAAIEAFGAMMLDLSAPVGSQRRLVAALVSRGAIRVGWRGHGAMLCI